MVTTWWEWEAVKFQGTAPTEVIPKSGRCKITVVRPRLTRCSLAAPRSMQAIPTAVGISLARFF